MRPFLKFWFIWPAAVIFLLITHKFGPGIDNDGTFYILFGKSLAAHGNLLHYDNAFKGAWPPGFPLIIAFFQWLHLPLIPALETFGLLLFTGTLCFAYLSADAVIKNKRYVAAFMVVLLVAYPLYSVYTKVLSDAPFIFLATAIMYFTIQLEKSFSLKYLIAFIACLALISIIRYAGLFFLITAIGYLLYAHRKNINRLVKIVLAGVLGFIPVGLWFVRNYFIIRHTTGLQLGVDIARIRLTGYDSMNEWILPQVISPLTRSIVFDAVVVGIAVFLWINRKGPGQILIIPAFFLGYAMAITLSVPLWQMEYRYVSPVFIPFVATLFLFLDRIQNRFAKLTTFAVLATLFFTQLVISSLFVIFRYQTGGGGYNTDDWQKSPTTMYLRNHPLKDTIYTNQIGACQYFNDDFAVALDNKMITPSSGRNSPAISRKGYLVLFKNKDRNTEQLIKTRMGIFSPVIKKAVNDTSLITDTYSGLPLNEFLSQFGASNNVAYSQHISLPDGNIYYYSTRP